MQRAPRPRWQLPLALLFIVPALMLAVGYTAFAASTPSPAGSAAPLPGDPGKGQGIYNSKCTACHGANLEGGVGPKLHPIENLGNTKDPLDPGYLIDVIGNGLNGVKGFGQMPAWKGQLSDQDIKDVAAYIIQQQKTQAGIDPVTLARSNVFWVAVGIAVMVFLTYLLARYNMRWIGRRAAARRERR